MKKFDFAIGNPPYQEQTESDSTRMPPVYNDFMDAAYSIADKVELITPARFLFDAGYTPKSWNRKMLTDPHFKVMQYESIASKLFPNTEIKGGVAITYRDAEKEYGALDIFTKYDKLNSILQKVNTIAEFSLDTIIFSPLDFQLSDRMKKEYPDLTDRLRSSAFKSLKSILYVKPLNDDNDYVKLIGLEDGKRQYKYIRRDYIKEIGDTLDKYTLLVSKANGNGSFGETLSASMYAPPGTAYTQTFIGIGAFDTEQEMKHVELYIKTKFCRAMLGVLKITQDCPGPKWKYVPLQDFTDNSDIDWSKSIKEIDQQLYKKYDLSNEEINFIESHVKEMK